MIRSYLSPSGQARVRFLLGLGSAVVLLLALAEGFLRLSPPADLHPYLGEDSPLCGPFQPDPDFGVAYRDWDSFLADAGRERDALASSHGRQDGDQRPLWAMFGNSFVQAPGMLADQARAQLPTYRIFNSGKNELLEVRLAQLKLLLERGFAPDRIFFELMPADLLKLGPHPLSTLHVTAKGAVTYTPGALPAPAAWLTRHSRLALTALVRSGQHCGNPRFNSKELYRHLDPVLLDDLEHLFGGLARLGREHRVPITVLLIPGYHQIARGESFQFQDTLGPVFERLGLDVFDPRDAFLACTDKDGLFIPDRHFSAAGNELLLAELLAHLGRGDRHPGVATVRREP